MSSYCTDFPDGKSLSKAGACDLADKRFLLASVLRTLFIGLAMLLCQPIDAYTQKKFIIASWFDPELYGDDARRSDLVLERRPSVRWDEASDEAALRAMKNSGFNTLLGKSYDMLIPGHTVWTRTQVEYKLRLLQRVGGLSMMVDDPRLYGRADFKTLTVPVSDVMDDYASLPNRVDTLVEGFLMRDEPHVNHVDHYGKTIDSIQALSAKKTGWVTLYQYGGGAFVDARTGAYNEAGYIRYVDDLLKYKPAIFAFDNYGLYCDNGTCFNVALVKNYYRNYQIIAEKAREYGSSFVGFANSIQMRAYETPTMPHQGAPFTYPPSTAYDQSKPRLKFQAFLPVVYGAKGIAWFTYSPPMCCRDGLGGILRAAEMFSHQAFIDTNRIETQIGRDGKEINAFLNAIGPKLMESNWQNTVHSDTINNVKTWGGILNNRLEAPESSLDTLDGRFPFISTIAKKNPYFALAWYSKNSMPTMISVLNKDLDSVRTIVLKMKRSVYSVRLLKFPSQSWRDYGKAKSLTLKLQPADIAFVEIRSRKIKQYCRKSW